MADPDHFCLKWNDFPDHIQSTFTGLLSSAPLFSDVTLACDDGNQLSAHRLVLAGSSSVLKTILTNMTASQLNPHLYLRGVSKADLSALLTFMYQGEVSLPQDQLNSFLSVAEDLQVKGLVDATKSQQSNRRLERLESKLPRLESKLPSKVIGAEPLGKKFRSNIGSDGVSVKSESPSVTNRIEAVPTSHELEPDPYNKYIISKAVEEEFDNLDNYGDGDLIQDHLSASTPSFSEQTWPDGRTEWTCSLCGKVFHHPGSTSQHIAVHQGRTTCNECGKVFNRVSDMRTHSRNVHQIYDLS